MLARLEDGEVCSDGRKEEESREKYEGDKIIGAHHHCRKQSSLKSDKMKKDFGGQ